MSADNKPECKEKGVEKSIKNDTFPGICGINLKRRDAIGATEDTIAVDTDSEWKLTRTTECSNAKSFHGGFSECTPGVSVLEWYTTNDELNWTDAKQYCEDSNGRMISEFNSTNEHIFWVIGSSPRRFWMGATDEQTEGCLFVVFL